jgi:long-chain acyl-CoA synthetase
LFFHILKFMEKDQERTLPLILRARVRETPGAVLQYAKDPAGWFTTKTYQQFYDEVRWAAAGLLELGVKRGDPLGLIADNRQEWLAADFAVLSIGAVDVPRGSDSMVQELSYILGFTECALSFAENQKQTEKLLACKKDLPCLKTLITFEAPDSRTAAAAAAQGLALISYTDLIGLGKKRRDSRPGEVDAEIDRGQQDDTCTIIFTSGTTGEPKGVMLTHGTFIHQLPCFRLILDIKAGDIFLSVLPVWHVFERAIEYVILYYSSGIAYSKPIASILMADFLEIKPHWMVAVPRIWEAVMDGIYRNVRQAGRLKKGFFNFSVSLGILYRYFRDLTLGLIPNYHGRIRALDAALGVLPWLLLAPLRGLAAVLVFNRIKKRLGGRFKAGISGGGTLPGRVDRFFNSTGILLLEGYGLTETSPIISVRQYKRPRRGTVGQILAGTEVRIIDNQGNSLPPGHNGIVCVRGGQVMKGYYRKPELTAAVLSPEGWLNTGDIGMLTRNRELRLTGRAKDTIVLRGGENVEPVPIEARLRESPWISQCMVVGQDQKYLAALIVPVQDRLMAFAAENNIPIVDYELLLQQPEINEVIANDVAELVGPKKGFKPFEGIYKFRLLPRPFEAGTELSAKQELLRHKIAVRYAKQIQSLFKQ